MNKIPLVVLGILAVLIVSGCTQSGQVTDEGSQQTTPAKTCRTVQEAYTVQVPYEAQEAYDYYPTYKHEGHTLREKANLELGFYHQAIVKLRNTDSEATWYIVKYTFKTVDGNQPIQADRHFIEPDEVVEYKFIFDSKMGQDVRGTYTVDVEPIIKYKTVTKYRPETRYRNKQVCD